MTILAHLLLCITRQRPGVDTIRGDSAAEREVVRCYGLPDFVSKAFEQDPLDASVARFESIRKETALNSPAARLATVVLPVPGKPLSEISMGVSL